MHPESSKSFIPNYRHPRQKGLGADLARSFAFGQATGASPWDFIYHASDSQTWSPQTVWLNEIFLLPNYASAVATVEEKRIIHLIPD
jgi:hypothetical protein